MFSHTNQHSLPIGKNMMMMYVVIFFHLRCKVKDENLIQQKKFLFNWPLLKFDNTRLFFT